MSEIKKCIQRCFVGILAGLTLLSLGRAVLFPREMNALENRYAVKLTVPTVERYLDHSLQDETETALMDQMPLSQTMKRLYYALESRVLFSAVERIAEKLPERYISYMKTQTFGSEYIVYPMRILSSITEALDQKAQGLNQTFARHPDVDFYLYYIEKDTDINFETNEKLQGFDYLQSKLDLPTEKQGVYRIDSFAEFSEQFYETDHHWNHKGSYRGYLALCELLGLSDPLEPLEEVNTGLTFSGSKAVTGGCDTTMSEVFSAYRYAFPPMEIRINGTPVGDYGEQDAYLNGERDSVQYGMFYGDDRGEVVFDSLKTDKKNLLVIGESFDNAVLKLLASHYGRTHAVDLRYYAVENGNMPFDFAEYVKKNDIDQVLLMGNVDYFLMPEFLPEGVQ